MLLFAGVASSDAASPKDSISTLQATLPDSTSLGGKVVYADFWASWCLPCRRSLPWMQELYGRYHPKGLEIVGICVDKNHDAALKMLQEYKITFPVVFDSMGSIAKKYKLDAMPTSFLYGRDGRLASQHTGFQDDQVDSLDAVIYQLLGRSVKK